MTDAHHEHDNATVALAENVGFVVMFLFEQRTKVIGGRIRFSANYIVNGPQLRAIAARERFSVTRVGFGKIAGHFTQGLHRDEIPCA